MQRLCIGWKLLSWMNYIMLETIIVKCDKPLRVLYIVLCMCNFLLFILLCESFNQNES